MSETTETAARKADNYRYESKAAKPKKSRNCARRSKTSCKLPTRSLKP